MGDPASAAAVGTAAGSSAAGTKAAAPIAGADLAGSEAAGISMAPAMLGAPGSSLMANLGATSAGSGAGLGSILGSNLQQLGAPAGLASKIMQAQMGAKMLGLPGIPGLSSPQMPAGAAGGARPFNAPMAPNSSLATLQQMTGPPTGGGSTSTAGLVGNRMGSMGGFPGAFSGMPPQLLLQLLASRGMLA